MPKLHRIAIVLIVCFITGIVAQTTHAANETSSTSSAATVAGIGNCPLFPADNIWNRDVSNDPIDPNSNNYIASINAPSANGTNQFLRAGFGLYPEYGLPYVVVPGTQPKVPITFSVYASQSDPGPYPVPANAPVEGMGIVASDKHVIVVDKDNCKLYEMYNATYNGTGWTANAGAVYDLTSNALRPAGWTSADASGMPIFPGLIRYDEVATGIINHALRFTVGATQKKYIVPARHYQSVDTNPNLPPMGMRVRLKKSFDISGYSGPARVILQALKTYGMFVADQGGPWYMTGTADSRWDRNSLETLRTVPGNAFEVIDTGLNTVAPTTTAIPATATKTNTPVPATATKTNTPIPATITPSGTNPVYWVDESLPAGAVTAGNEAWTWVTSSPSPHTGTKSHQSIVIAGPHQHYFSGTTTPLQVNTGDYLITSVYLDPANMPSEIMMQWNDGAGWEHRAYWGSNSIAYGIDGTNSRRYQGALPAAGQWVLLQVPASQLGLEGVGVRGMAFVEYNGRATWDSAGKSNVLLSVPATTVPTKTSTVAPTKTATVAPASTAIPATATKGSTAVPTVASAAQIKVQYRPGDPTVGDDMIKPFFNVVNTGGTAVPLSELRLRYWFTRDTAQNVAYGCDWAVIGCPNLIGNVVMLPNAFVGADGYLEIGFQASAGNLGALSQTSDIQLRMNKADWSMFNESNDYSFDTTPYPDLTKIVYKDWSKVTLYRNGQLIWGTEPNVLAMVNSAALAPGTLVPTTVPLPTSTIAPTKTLVPPTSTIAPTKTLVPPTSTIAPTKTLVPPTSTSIPPTATLQPTTQFVPPTNTALPPTTGPVIAPSGSGG